jgi:aryl-alcohol dehydrogenase-like predicted oxidoreductase
MADRTGAINRSGNSSDGFSKPMTPMDFLKLSRPIQRLIVGTHNLSDSGECRQRLDQAFELGLKTFDTARIYSNGESEGCLGRWIRERSLQGHVTVITKGGYPAKGIPRLTPHDLRADVEGSLRSLHLDCIDIFLLHRDDRKTDVGAIISTVNELRAEQKLRAFGASNWSSPRIACAQEFARQRGLESFQVSSLHFSLAEWVHTPWPGCLSLAGRGNSEERMWYTRNRLPVIAWSSLASGFFCENPSTSSEMNRFREHVYGSPANLERLRRAQMLARARNISVAQIALAFVLNQPLDIYAVVSSSDPAHLAADARAAEIELVQDELDWLNLEQNNMPL